MTHIKLSNGLKTIFKKEFLNPVEKMFNENVISKPENKQAKNNQRNQILKQGRANFDNISDGLNPNQKVDLYCYHYFQMHFTSSYVFFLKEKELILDLLKDSELHFIDIGCGPMTSGIAFNSYMSKFAPKYKNANYIGVDISQNMVNRAERIINGENFNLNFNKTCTLIDKNQIVNYLEEIRNNELPQSIIINYSFLFASESLVVQDFIDFTMQLYENCSTEDGKFAKFVVFYQNPKLGSLNVKWEEYKNGLEILNSQIHYPKNIRYTFDDELGSSSYPSPTLSAKFDLIKSY